MTQSWAIRIPTPMRDQASALAIKQNLPLQQVLGHMIESRLHLANVATLPEYHGRKASPHQGPSSVVKIEVSDASAAVLTYAANNAYAAAHAAGRVPAQVPGRTTHAPLPWLLRYILAQALPDYTPTTPRRPGLSDGSLAQVRLPTRVHRWVANRGEVSAFVRSALAAHMPALGEGAPITLANAYPAEPRKASNVRLDVVMHEQLRALARKTGRPMVQIIEHCVMQAVVNILRPPKERQ